MSTQQARSHPTPSSIRRRARWESVRVDFHGHGVWGVQRFGGDPHTVMLRDGRIECDCQSFNFDCIHGPLKRCIHAEVVHQIVHNDLCPSCAYPRCRPSCPRRGDHR